MSELYCIKQWTQNSFFQTITDIFFIENMKNFQLLISVCKKLDIYLSNLVNLLTVTKMKF